MQDTNKNSNEIQSSFQETLRDTDLTGFAIDVAELKLNNIMDDGFLQDIPIIRLLASLLKTGANIKDRLFIKKIISFLAALNDVSVEDRKKMINSIDSSKQYKIKVGEKLLYIIDSCEDYEISELVSTLFKHFIEKNITYEDFLRTSSILKNMNKVDFDRFVSDDGWYHFDIDEVSDLLHTGLFKILYKDVEVSVLDQDDYKLLRDNGSRYKYSTEVDGGIDVNLSKAGEILRKIFSDTQENKV